MITIAEYLVARLEKLGIKAIFGLPGDFNFRILDAVVSSKGVDWVNCTNELNAGYVADGYARKNGFGAVVTTFGVGELSAMNAIAGAYAENIPVMKIVGVPPTKMIRKNAIIHHNFAVPNYKAFAKAYSNIVETTAFLNKENAKAEIDRIISVMIATRKPVYVAIPVDICNLKIEAGFTDFKLQKSDEKELHLAVNAIKKLYEKSKKPIIMLDYLVKRFKLEEEVKKLSEKIQIPVSNLIMGKDCFDENSEFFIGTNLGNISSCETQKIINDSDLVISIGTVWSDLNTAGFNALPKETYKIEILANKTIIEKEVFDNVLIGDIICELEKALTSKKYENHKDFGYDVTTVYSEKQLKVDEIFPVLEDFLEENDNIIVETGIVTTPSGNLKLPKGCSFNTQTLWGSIGWATPAAFGVAMAEKNRRTILLTGDGSHQLTVQEIANMFEYDIKPIILVLNNNGYTIERLLSKDPLDIYNNITNWNYSKVPELFGNNSEYYFAQAKTQKEFFEIMKKAQHEQKTKLCYLEVFTSSLDSPVAVKTMIENMKAYNKKVD